MTTDLNRRTSSFANDCSSTSHVSFNIQQSLHESWEIASQASHQMNDAPIDMVQADAFDDLLLKRAVTDAGQWAYGAVIVEVWVMNTNHTKLFRPDSGWFMDPIVHRGCEGYCNLCRLTNPKHPDYLDPVPLSPGVGLPGILWNESITNTRFRRTVSSTMHDSRNKDIGIHGQVTNRAKNITAGKCRVAWRDIEYLALDPDQPPNRRLKGLVEAGLGWGAGISFDIGDRQGIVVFMTRKCAHVKKLRTLDNEAYLISASNLIGSAWSLRGPRHRVIMERRRQRCVLLRRIRAKLLSQLRSGVTIEEIILGHGYQNNNGVMVKCDVERPSSSQLIGNTSEESNQISMFKPIQKLARKLQKKVHTVAKKSIEGGKSQPPPPKSNFEALYSACGAFIAFLMVSKLNEHMIGAHGSEFRLIIEPLAGLATLNYALTAAPASQPRNCFLAQLVALPIGILMSMSDLVLYLRQAISLFLTVLLTSKLGIIHPPSGATAVIFSSGLAGWTEMLSLLLGYTVIIGTSIIVNNANKRRQYPTYWGFHPISDIYALFQDMPSCFASGVDKQWDEIGEAKPNTSRHSISSFHKEASHSFNSSTKGEIVVAKRRQRRESAGSIPENAALSFNSSFEDTEDFNDSITKRWTNTSSSNAPEPVACSQLLAERRNQSKAVADRRTQDPYAESFVNRSRLHLNKPGLP